MYKNAHWLIAALLAFVPARVRTGPDLSGTYVIDRRASDDPKRALEAATSSMRRFKRNAVDKRIEDEMKPADTLAIAQHGDSVALTTSGRLHLTVVPDGTPKARPGTKGGNAEMTSTWQGETLVVKTTAEKFQREARYALDDNGARIRVAITMHAGELSQPISYTLVYRRVAGANASPAERQ